MLWHVCWFEQGPYIFGPCTISALLFIEFKGRCLCVVFSLWCSSCIRVCLLSSLLCSPFGADLYELASRGWPTTTFSIVLSSQRSSSTCRSSSRQWLSSHTRQLYLFLAHRRIVCVRIICIVPSSFWDIGIDMLRWQCLMIASAQGLATIGVGPILSRAQSCGGCSGFWLMLLLQGCSRLEGAWFVGELWCRVLVLQALATTLKALINRAFVARVRRYWFSCWWLISHSLLLICKWITCLYLINRLGHLSIFGLTFCLWVFRLTLTRCRWHDYLSRNLCKRVFGLVLSLLRLLIVIFLRLNLLFWLRSYDFDLLDRLIV